ncbi:Membrane protein involved in aromatic hydrocarbon degradation, partial [human gut metagenome]
GEATNNTIAGLLTAAGQGQYAELFTQAGDRSLVSARIKGDAKTAIGVNVGILWDITPEWTLGFSYRSKVKMKVASGTANLLYASPEIGQVLQATGMIPDLSSACVETELPLPANLAWGVGFRPTPKWEMAFDIQYVLWSAYKSLHVDITDPTTGASVYDLPTSIKNYKNTV